MSAAAVFVAYQAGVHQDRKRWYRERRAELYIDLLVEAYAEKEWCLMTMSRREMTAEFGELDERDEALYARLEAASLPASGQPSEPVLVPGWLPTARRRSTRCSTGSAVA